MFSAEDDPMGATMFTDPASPARQVKIAKIVAVLDACRKALGQTWAEHVAALCGDDVDAAAVIAGDTWLPITLIAGVNFAAAQAGVNACSAETLRLVLAHIDAAASAEADPFAGITATIGPR